MIRTNGVIMNEQVNTVATNESLRSSAYRPSYHEITDSNVAETDVLAQLRANISQLEDLHGRMKFMMAEVGYLLKKS